MEVKEPRVLGGLGNKKSNNGTQYYQQDRVYSSDGIAMCHPANIPGGSYKYMIDETKTIVAMRGRNPDNPSDRTPGVKTEQRLEPNRSGVCNALTSVQKDNMVLVAGGKEMKALIKQATKQGYIECKIGGVADLSYPNSKTRRGRVQDCGNTPPTLTAGENDICKIESPYRIRKLTPKECWRLMGFSDEEFQSAEEVNSSTHLYKQAGNSIVVNVLVAIIGQMISGHENDYKNV